MVNNKRIRASSGSRRGLHCVAACSSRIANQGVVDLELTTAEGHKESWVARIVDVNKPLGAVTDRVDNCCRAVYDKNMDTGQGFSYIFESQRAAQSTI